MVEFSRDQEGSRLIQRKLEGLQCTDNEKDMVFSEVFKEALGLMTDVFGNYVIQKLFEHGLPNHRKLLATVCGSGWALVVTIRRRVMYDRALSPLSPRCTTRSLTLVRPNFECKPGYSLYYALGRARRGCNLIPLGSQHDRTACTAQCYPSCIQDYPVFRTGASFMSIPETREMVC